MLLIITQGIKGVKIEERGFLSNSAPAWFVLFGIFGV